MPEFCSCGAQLPPDARFCHRCGKPQREEAEMEPATTPVETRPEALPLSFHNPIAVRVGLLMASAAALLTWVLVFGFVIWWFTAGFLAVYVYHRRAGGLMTVRSGARMGWITGVLTFAITTVLVTTSIIVMAMSSGGFAARYREQVRNIPLQDPNMGQILQFLQSPGGIAVALLVWLFLIFVMIAILCTAGGALGAKIVGKD
jgi:hypothetical protein